MMDKSTNNNCEYYEDLDTNFKLAYKLCECEYSHEELLEMLNTGNIPQKQIAALKFDYVKTKDDALALLNNLTGCDGKIREAVALKINHLLLSDKKSRNIFAKLPPDIFANATIDINANICRLIVDSAALIKEYTDFSTEYTNIIMSFAEEALNEIDKFIFRDKKYVINKQIFKLYWCLEALNEFYSYTNEKKLEKVIKRCAVQKEYTIREKTAQLLSNINKYPDIKISLENDENYYVRQALHHPSFF